MGYGVFMLCLTLTLTVTLTVSVELDPPKPFGTKTIYNWSFTAQETTGKYVTTFVGKISQLVKHGFGSLHDLT